MFLIWVTFVDGMTSQSMVSVDGEKIHKALKKRWCLSWFSSWNSGRVKMDERWHGSLFQISDATDDNDIDFAITVLHVETRKTSKIGEETVICNGGPPLQGFLIQQVIQQALHQIIQLFRSLWVRVTDCCMTFLDQNLISTTSVHVQMLKRLRTCCMSLVNKSVRWRRVTANHTAFNVFVFLLTSFIASFHNISDCLT